MHTSNTPTDYGCNIQQMNYKDYIEKDISVSISKFSLFVIAVTFAVFGSGAMDHRLNLIR